MMSNARKGDAPDMRSEASVAKNICGVISMSSLANLTSHPQVRASIRGNRFVYEIKLSNGYQETNYKFVEWLVGDFNASKQVKA
ncbi:hypothetical protein PROVRUST_04513 [Providencia rustigianii DSM 4541]|uniref:Uncharacterized protein n=2 Tax=Providencia rustigianii TaxID=158850 RepID=D1NX85_9GAMM|nr:hypothetical protein PROVRUST_04513 [Providencia rustigianii DSM 4541]SUC26290.1 Uncharacterised protein [Providencia rustigianii]